MSLYSLELDIDPVPFDRPRFRLGRGFNSPKYAAFKRAAGICMREQFRRTPLAEALNVAVRFKIKRPKTVKRPWPTVVPDVDNFLKGILDSANGILWRDDAQICRVTGEKSYADRGAIIIEVYLWS